MKNSKYNGINILLASNYLNARHLNYGVVDSEMFADVSKFLNKIINSLDSVKDEILVSKVNDIKNKFDKFAAYTYQDYVFNDKNLYSEFSSGVDELMGIIELLGKSLPNVDFSLLKSHLINLNDAIAKGEHNRLWYHKQFDSNVLGKPQSKMDKMREWIHDNFSFPLTGEMWDTYHKSYIPWHAKQQIKKEYPKII